MSGPLLPFLCGHTRGCTLLLSWNVLSPPTAPALLDFGNKTYCLLFPQIGAHPQEAISRSDHQTLIISAPQGLRSCSPAAVAQRLMELDLNAGCPGTGRPRGTSSHSWDGHASPLTPSRLLPWQQNVPGPAAFLSVPVHYSCRWVQSISHIIMHRGCLAFPSPRDQQLKGVWVTASTQNLTPVLPATGTHRRL